MKKKTSCWGRSGNENRKEIKRVTVSATKFQLYVQQNQAFSSLVCNRTCRNDEIDCGCVVTGSNSLGH